MKSAVRSIDIDVPIDRVYALLVDFHSYPGFVPNQTRARILEAADGRWRVDFQLSVARKLDYVLDLHCDNESVIHLYAATPQWSQVEPLARAVGAEVSLLATDSGDDPFDEACSLLWSRLNRAWQSRGGGADA